MSKEKRMVLDYWQVNGGSGVDDCLQAVAILEVSQSNPDYGYIHIYEDGKNLEKDNNDLLNLNKEGATQLVRFILSNGLVDLDDVLLGKPND